jgi:Protein of unknown function (DUF3108)
MEARKSLALAIALFAALLIAAPAFSEEYDFTGEHLVYEFGWKGFTAAKVDIKIGSIPYKGHDCYDIDMKLNSLAKLDWIWKVRDRMTAYVRKSDGLPERFMYYQREGTFFLDTEIVHDQDTGRFQSTRTRIKDGKKKPYRSKWVKWGEHYDPVGALLRMRALPLEEGKTYTIKSFDGKREHEISYKVVGKEKIKIALGEFEAFRIEPRIVKSSGDKEKTNVDKVRKVTAWIATTPDQNVLKIESKVFVGAVYAELVKKKKN